MIKKSGRRVSHAWAKEDLESDSEPTLRGREQQAEVRNDRVIYEYVRREQGNTHKLQNRALIGLALVLLEVAIIVLIVVVGVEERWLTTGFAEIVLATTVPPSIAAWMYVVKRIFPSSDQRQE